MPLKIKILTTKKSQSHYIASIYKSILCLLIATIIGSNILFANYAIPKTAVTAMSKFGKPKYKDPFTFEYVDQKAPKGGNLNLSAIGTFDTLNIFIIKGISAEGLRDCYESMMIRGNDEPFTLYCRLAKAAELAGDNSSITFYIHPDAKFQDGSPVLAEDFKATIETLSEKGAPRYKRFSINGPITKESQNGKAGGIAKVEILDPRVIKIYFNPSEFENGKPKYDKEMAMSLCLISVLQAKQLKNIDFAGSGLKVIMGSGPYKIKSAQPGRVVVLERDKNYWGKDLAVNRGKYNFDTIKIEYFKNNEARFQAFTVGEYDINFEVDPSTWRTRYNFKAINNGQVKLIDMVHGRQVPVRSIIFNMRKPIFSDWRLRKALALAFDFDTLNKMVYFGEAICMASLFQNTYLAHNGPAKGRELELLKAFESQIDPEAFHMMVADSFKPARTNANGDQRENLKKADNFLKQAGWNLVNGKRVNSKGQQLALSIMLKDQRLQRVALSYQESLKKLGIMLTVKMIDNVQYENCVTESDFDMIFHTWSNSLSPGIEQKYYFGTKTADIKGSSNYIGLKDHVAEDLAAKVASARTQEESTDAVHALDRYVMHMCYQVPIYSDNRYRVAYWKDKIAFPEIKKDLGITVVAEWGWAVSK